MVDRYKARECSEMTLESGNIKMVTGLLGLSKELGFYSVAVKT